MTSPAMAYAVPIDPQGPMEKAVGAMGIPRVLIIERQETERRDPFSLVDGFQATEQTAADMVALQFR